MTSINVTTISGESKGTVSLKKTKAPSSILVSNAVLANLSNKRQSIAHTKTKGEVSGGGKKPWKQKGTGRARVGSNRSPLWIGGGVTFGPRNNSNFYKRINKKQSTLVVGQLLTEKAEGNYLKIIEDFEIASGKTRDMIKTLSSLGIDDNALLVLDNKLAESEKGTQIYNSGKNISFLKTIGVDKLSAFMILKYKWLIITKEAFNQINEKLPEMKESAPAKKESKQSGQKKVEKKEIKEDKE